LMTGMFGTGAADVIVAALGGHTANPAGR